MLGIHAFKHSAPSKYGVKNSMQSKYQKENQGDMKGSPHSAREGNLLSNGATVNTSPQE
jgi:hypothetical protein